MRHFLGRILTPTGFLLTGMCLLLPFITVSCDAPGGFGRAAPGGTTTYTGLDFVTGGRPMVDKLLPAAQQRDDRLGIQLLAVTLVLVVIAGATATWLLRERRVRRITAAALAAAAVVLLLANQATTIALVQARLSEQLAAPMPAGKRAADFVHTAFGFAACLLMASILLGTNLIASGIQFWRDRRDRVPRSDLPPATDLPTPADPWAAG